MIVLIFVEVSLVEGMTVATCHAFDRRSEFMIILLP